MVASRLAHERPTWGRIARRIDGWTERRLFAVVALPLFALYLATASWSYPLFNDTFTNTITAWNLGTRGSLYLEDHTELEPYYSWYAWLVPAGDSVAGKYPPGAPLLAAPLYAIWPTDATSLTIPPDEIPEPFRLGDDQSVTFLQPPIAPAAIIAALSTAAAVGFLALAFVRVGGSVSMSLLAAYLAGVGTSTWAFAADQLWQHGPAMAWIALALVLSAGQPIGSGFAFGAAILTRPHTAVIAAATGLFRGLKAKSWRPVVQVGLGATFGLMVYLAFNWWLFGSPTLSAGYGPVFQNRLQAGLSLSYLENIIDGFVAPRWGMFVWSPFLLALIPGLRAGWKAAPPWARGAALGGVIYLLIQYKVNRSSGIFSGYRYPLEALTAAAPVLFLSYREWLSSRRMLRLAFLAAVAASVLLAARTAVFGIAV